MKSIVLLAAIGTVISVAPGSAADLAARPYTKAPPPVAAAIYDWSGFYLGVNGGGGSSHKCWDLTNFGGVLVAPAIGMGCHDATGGTIGGQIGYRWQAANWVFGVEGQGNWADFSGSNTNPLFFAGVTARSKINAFGMLTGQVGYAWNNVLLYVKGGAAAVGDKYDFYNLPNGALISSARETRWGGAVGAGLEVGFAPNWSVGVEYNHLFLGSRDVNFTTPAGVFDTTEHISQSADIGTVRVNYRWGAPVIAKY